MTIICYVYSGFPRTAAIFIRRRPPPPLDVPVETDVPVRTAVVKHEPSNALPSHGRGRRHVPAGHVVTQCIRAVLLKLTD